MSTHLQKPTLARIFNYGAEALGNRRKMLVFIAFYFIFCPQFIVWLVWGRVASGVKTRLLETATLSPLHQAVDVFTGIGSQVLAPVLSAAVFVMIGILALARTSVDYFESRPDGFKNTLMKAARVFLTKGLGAVILLIILMPVLTIMPLLRAVALSMLVMLPVTLVASTSGGFTTTWDTLFLRYASSSRYGRWPVFINVLSVAGLFLTALFGISLLIDSLTMADLWFEVPAGILENDLVLGGLTINWGHFLSDVFNLGWESLAIAVIIPFTAAVFHVSTIPEDHTPFETKA